MKSLATWPLLLIFALLTATAAQAGTPPLSPEQTIRQIYQPYSDRSTPVMFGGTQVSARMNQAIKLDEQLALPGDVGSLDYDPICNCQDFDNLVLEKITLTPKDAEHVDATVRFRPFKANSDSITQTLNLIVEDNHWVIDDILNGRNSLYQMLNGDNQQKLATLTALQRELPQDYVRALFEHLSDNTWPWTWVLAPDYRQAIEGYKQAVSQMGADRSHDELFLYANPLCNCIETQFVSLDELRLIASTPNSARIHVQLTLGEDAKEASLAQEIKLQRVDGDWMVADIIRLPSGSLLAQMRATTATMEKGNK